MTYDIYVYLSRKSALTIFRILVWRRAFRSCAFVKASRVVLNVIFISASQMIQKSIRISFACIYAQFRQPFQILKSPDPSPLCSTPPSSYSHLSTALNLNFATLPCLSRNILTFLHHRTHAQRIGRLLGKFLDKFISGKTLSKIYQQFSSEQPSCMNVRHAVYSCWQVL